jgi:hypothetical protein
VRRDCRESFSGCPYARRAKVDAICRQACAAECERQIHLFGMPEQMSTEKSVTDHIGGIARVPLIALPSEGAEGRFACRGG